MPWGRVARVRPVNAGGSQIPLRREIGVRSFGLHFPHLRTERAGPLRDARLGYEVRGGPPRPPRQNGKEVQMIILGIVLVVVVVGLVAGIPILETIGVILLVVGAILWALGSMGRAVGGRKHYY